VSWLPAMSGQLKLGLVVVGSVLLALSLLALALTFRSGR
jgi:hypothetical protein